MQFCNGKCIICKSKRTTKINGESCFFICKSKRTTPQFKSGSCAFTFSIDPLIFFKHYCSSLYGSTSEWHIILSLFQKVSFKENLFLGRIESYKLLPINFTILITKICSELKSKFIDHLRIRIHKFGIFFLRKVSEWFNNFSKQV
jgi:hypothetical protein